MIAPFPRAADARRNALAERQMQPVIDVVSAIRAIRSESRINARRRSCTVTVKPGAAGAEGLAEAAPLVGALARVGDRRRSPRPSGRRSRRTRWPATPRCSFTSTAWSISRPSAAAS